MTTDVLEHRAEVRVAHGAIKVETPFAPYLFETPQGWRAVDVPADGKWHNVHVVNDLAFIDDVPVPIRVPS